MLPPDHRASLKRLSLSPPAWKDQLRQRCLQRLKRDRGQLLAKLRRPDASVSEEMQRLVAHEQQEASTASVDDLLLLGRLKESDYMEIVHALEDALRQEGKPEEELRLAAEHMENLEDAELEAMLRGMDLDEQPSDETPMQTAVLCPSCKAGYLKEEATSETPFISCGCGFTFHVKFVYHSVLEDFQDKVVNGFMSHRDSCPSDPTFDKKTSVDGVDALCIQCTRCGCNQTLP